MDCFACFRAALGFTFQVTDAALPPLLTHGAFVARSLLALISLVLLLSSTGYIAPYVTDMRHDSIMYRGELHLICPKIAMTYTARLSMQGNVILSVCITRTIGPRKHNTIARVGVHHTQYMSNAHRPISTVQTPDITAYYFKIHIFYFIC